MIKLSIIVPIFKVENYIIECIESICCQLINGVEVILVNDGTPDKSMILAKNYIMDKYSNHQDKFVYIDQENKGQSIARNVALKIAKGEYIAFLDSDDLLYQNYFKNLFEVLKDVDIVQFKSARFYNNKADFKYFNVGLIGKNGCEQNTTQLMLEIFNQNAWFPWLNVYKKELFLNLEFPKDIYFEDAVTIPEVFLRAKNIYFIDEIMYLYRVNFEGSILNNSNSNIEKKFISFEFVLKIYLERLKNKIIYSSCFISMLQGYVSCVYKQSGLIPAIVVYKKYSKYIKLVDTSKINKRGNLMFLKFGVIFIVLLGILGKL